jgi:hypothetical protein
MDKKQGQGTHSKWRARQRSPNLSMFLIYLWTILLHMLLVHNLFGPVLCFIHLWTICMFLSHEFVGLWSSDIYPWTIGMHVPGTSLSWSRAV